MFTHIVATHCNDSIQISNLIRPLPRIIIMCMIYLRVAPQLSNYICLNFISSATASCQNRWLRLKSLGNVLLLLLLLILLLVGCIDVLWVAVKLIISVTIHIIVMLVMVNLLSLMIFICDII